jgi:hypothetical protein
MTFIAFHIVDLQRRIMLDDPTGDSFTDVERVFFYVRTLGSKGYLEINFPRGLID